MVQPFDKRTAALGLGTANVQGHGPYDIIKVASLIEAEAKVDADRPLIASVIYNRLALRMPSQIDATLIYARGDPANRKLSDDGQADQLAVQHVHASRAAADADRRGQRRVAAGRAASRADAYLYYVVIDKPGTRVRVDARGAEQNIAIAHRNGVG